MEGLDREWMGGFNMIGWRPTRGQMRVGSDKSSDKGIEQHGGVGRGG